MKTVCPIHRFTYSGETCPFCEKDRIEYLTRKYSGEETNEETTKNKKRDISEDDLKKLLDKFNKRT